MEEEEAKSMEKQKRETRRRRLLGLENFFGPVLGAWLRLVTIQ
jgi:hypothetical protein